MKNHDYYMKIAIELAKKGIGKVNPNPLVGAVVVKNDEIIGKGYHKFFGGPHAEVYALEEAGEEAKGATIYVTLEPCSHHGKTPPCAEKIVNMGISKCVIATLDPNELVSGRGIEILKNAGIEVEIGILEKESKELNKVFFKYIVSKTPYLFLKCAITLDGKIATKSGDSKWISNEKARNKVQEYRNQFMSILIGANTLINDNPNLTARIEKGRDPYRIIVDPDLLINKSYNIVANNKDEKTIIVTSKNNENITKIEELKNYKVKFIFLDGKYFELTDILKEIGEIGIDSILLEGGSHLISQAFREDLIDSGEIFVSNKILGDSEGISFVSGFGSILEMSKAIELKNIKYNIYDNNIGIEFSK